MGYGYGNALGAAMARRYALTERPRPDLTLRGGRVELRPIGEADHEAWGRLRSDSGEGLPVSNPEWPAELGDPVASPKDFAKLLRIFDAAAADGLHYAFGVHAADGFVGEAHLGIALTGPLAAQLDLQIDARHTGDELGEEVVILLFGLAFDELGMHRVEGPVDPENVRVRRQLEKLGIRSEGIAERYLKVGGEWRDHERYAFTAEEWAARRDELTGTWLR